jgi:hypothetical protein
VSRFLISVSFLPVFSALAVRARLVVLNPGSAFILLVIKSFAVEAQFLVSVTRHFSFYVLTFTIARLRFYKKECL